MFTTNPMKKINLYSSYFDKTKKEKFIIQFTYNYLYIKDFS